MAPRRRSAAALIALSIAGACGGDYWLGGRQARMHGGGSGGSVALERDAGADAGPVDGQVLHADVVLTGDQSFELGPGACRLVGNGYAIRSEGTWLGTLSIRGCIVSGLGSASSEAIALVMSGDASATISDTTFSTSGAIHVTNNDDSSTTFRNNVIVDDSVVVLDPSFDRSTPAFRADGGSNAPKLFQGNRIERSMCWFGSSNWLIGGDSSADSNLLAGLSAGLVLDASGLVVRGNYVHNLHYPGSGDESSLSVIYGTSDVLAEHNVLRGGDWVIRGFGGELRYNAILDVDGDNWLNQPFDDTQVHHNLFAMCHPPQNGPPSGIPGGIHLVNARTSGIEIYSNTLDGGGPDMLSSGAALSIDEDCFLASLRSNVVFNFPYWRNDGGAAAIRPNVLESVEPPPPRIGYADYNLFYNPDAEQIRNYAVSVPDRALRADPGFALHDAQSGGPVDEQVDPLLAAPSGDCFAWSDDQILAGEPTVSLMLSTLRAAYRPLPDSPVLAAGDPADGAGTAIGAIGDGSDPNDRFGTF